MLSGFGRERACVMERAMREEYERLRQQAALGETFTLLGYTKEQLVHMIEVIEEHAKLDLRKRSPQGVADSVRWMIKNGNKKCEPKPKTKEQLAEHLYYLSMNTQGSICCPDWEHNKSVHSFWLGRANEMIVKGWEESQ